MNFIKVAEALKPWVSAKEIQIIANCGENQSHTIRKEIEKQIKAENKKLIQTKPKQVPIKRVLDYLELDENYIRSRALKEIELNQRKGGGE